MGGQVTVQIPVPLRPFAGGQAEVAVAGATVGEVLAALVARYPELRRPLFTEGGRLRNFVNVFVGEEHILGLQGLATPVAPGQTLALVPAIAGGAPRGPPGGSRWRATRRRCGCRRPRSCATAATSSCPRWPWRGRSGSRRRACS